MGLPEVDPNLPISLTQQGLHIRLAKETQRFFLLLVIATVAGWLASLAGIGGAWSLSKAVNDLFLLGKSPSQLSWLFAVLLALIFARSFLVWLSEKYSSRLATQVKTDLRERTYAQILALGPAYIKRNQSGNLVNLLVEGVEALEAYYSQYLPQVIFAVLIPLAILGCVFPADPLSGLILLLTAPIIPIFMILIASISANLTQKQWKTLSWMSAFFLEILQGLTTLKILGRSKDRAKLIAQISERYRVITLSVLRVTFLTALVMELTATLSTALIAVEIGIRLLYGKIAFEQAFFILVLVPEFYLPLRLLGLRFHAGMAGAAAAKQIYAVLDEVPKNEPANLAGLSTTRPPGNKPFDQQALPANWGIRFENVSFSYEKGQPVLENISFEIKPGQRIALVGPSGAGKSTLTSLLLRFFTPDQGCILAHQDDLQTFPLEEWHQLIAWVSQRPYLFADTVAANIRLAKPSASDEEVISAAKLAHADGFIKELPNGYETQVGERGARLSLGQAQRIALARAFLKDAPLLILDEPTANLDPELEAQLQDSIHHLMAGKTVIVIAHRLSTVSEADQILVLDGGKIVESGNHQDLLAAKGLYWHMVRHKKIGSRRGMEDSDLPDEKPAPPSQPISAQEQIDQSTMSPLKWGIERKGNYQSFKHLVSLISPANKWVFLSILLGFLAITCGIGLGATSTYIISAAALQPSIAALQVAIVGVRFFGIFRSLFRYLERITSHQVTFKLLAQLRVWFYQAIEPLAPARLMSFHSGDLLSRIISDVSLLENFFVRGVAPPLVALLISSLMVIFFYPFSPWLSGMILFFLGIGGIIFPLWAWRAGKGASYRAVHLRAQLNKTVVGGIQGLAELMIFNQISNHVKNFQVENRALNAAQEQSKNLNATVNALSIFNSHLALWLVLIVGGWLTWHGQFNAVLLGVLCIATLACFEAVQPLPLVASTLEKDLEATHRLRMVTKPEPMQKISAGNSPEPQHFGLEVKCLSFAYPPEWQEKGQPLDRKYTFVDVLHEIDFSIQPGEYKAIVGPSGAGKSTLIHLLLRFWDYQSGQINFGGHDLRQYAPEQLPRWFNVLPQTPYLFSGTIRENLLLAKPEATQAELEQAVWKAQLKEFIESLPEGFQTWIGEQGVRLSAGERQRLALARMFLRDAPILITDEATANLDVLHEQKILSEIHLFSRNRGWLTITHRLVGMKKADEILVFNHGVIVARGNHAQLIRQAGLYRQMWELQNRPGE